MISAQQKFFNILARFYEDYGIPGVCGWIDALLNLYIFSSDGKPWTQRNISSHLSNLFPKPRKYPTSVSSINRAIKINLEYCTIIKDGSHKEGYTYKAAEGSDLLISMFQNLIDKNRFYLGELEQLKGSPEPIGSAVEIQVQGILYYNQMLEDALNSAKNAIFLDEKSFKGDE